VATSWDVSERLLGWGAGIDAGMLYFDVRQAQVLPTVEVRVADVCTDLEDTVLVALLTRALVTTTAGDPDPVTWRGDLLRAASWRAAKVGLSDDLVHPVEGRLVPPRQVFGAALAYARAALEEAGDLDTVAEGFERLVSRGNGATRQHRVRETGGDLRRVVEDLARRTEESWG